ncbi:MAG: ABC transporter substrate-binding protein [Acidimicrobiales bacterium]
MPPTGAPATTTADPTAQADRTVFLKVVTSTGPQQLDPARSTFPCDSDDLALIYDTLIREQPDGSYGPGLAESWKTVDANTFELKLKANVKFQDGTAFNAQAVKAALDRSRTLTTSTLAKPLAFISGVEAVDDLTVRLRLSEARAGTLPALLADRAGMVPSPAAVAKDGDKYGANGAVGAGPYRYVELTPGTHIKLERWDGYNDPKTQLLGGYESFGVSVQFQVEQLKKGDLNYAALNEASFPDVKKAADEGAIKYVVDPTTQYMQFFVNPGAAPFDDLRVRQALNFAIDRDAVNKAIAEGIGTIAWGPLPASSWAHNKDVEGMYKYDPAQAKKLLADAGYKDGLTIPTGMIQLPLYQRTTELLQGMMAAAGFKLEIVPVPPAEINNRLYVTKDLKAAVTAFNASSDPGLALEARFAKNGANNPSGVVIAGLDALLTQGAATTSQADRAKAYKDAELLVMKGAYEVPIYHFGGLVAFRPEMQNIVKGYTACKGGNFLAPAIYALKK